MTSPVILSIALICLIFVVIEYLKARNLFFRNDEWHYMTKALWYVKSSTFKERISFLFDDLWGEGKEVLSHVHPLSLFLLYEKFRIFKTKFHLHFYVSLFFHIVNIFLIYWVCLKMSSNQIASITGAILFGACALIADTVFLPGFLVYILMVTLMLLSITLHPVFNHEESYITYVLFYLVNALSPWLMELGLVTVFISLFLFIIYNKIEILFVSLLLIVIALPLFLRLYLSRRIKNSGFCFIGFSQILKNTIIGNIKLLLGLFGARFKMKTTDTLYMMEPDFKSLFTLVSVALTATISYYLLSFLFDEKIVLVNKLEMALFLISASSPFLMVSFAYNKTNPNKDLSHQMPRYYYMAISLVVIVFSVKCFLYIDILLNILIWLFVTISGIASIRQQIAILKPHTDSMKTDVEAFIETGLMPQRQAVRPIEDYRLDWSFNELAISALYKIGIKENSSLDALGINKLGEQEFENGNYERAKRHFIDSLILDPTNVAPYNNLGVLFFHTGNINLSLQYFMKGIYLVPRNKALAVNFIHLLISVDSYDAAETICRFSIYHNPNDEELLSLFDVIKYKRDNK